MEEGIFSESRPKVRKVTLDDKHGDFDCYGQSKGKLVRVDVDKEMAESNKSTLVLLRNSSEVGKINNNGETRDRYGKSNLR